MLFCLGKKQNHITGFHKNFFSKAQYATANGTLIGVADVGGKLQCVWNGYLSIKPIFK